MTVTAREGGDETRLTGRPTDPTGICGSAEFGTEDAEGGRDGEERERWIEGGDGLFVVPRSEFPNPHFRYGRPPFRAPFTSGPLPGLTR
jgi:hypothetical protein